MIVPGQISAANEHRYKTGHPFYHDLMLLEVPDLNDVLRLVFKLVIQDWNSQRGLFLAETLQPQFNWSRAISSQHQFENPSKEQAKRQ